MEDFNESKNPVVELPQPLPLGETSPESELANVQTDKVKHSSEQASANISSGLGDSQDSSMVLPVVDDSTLKDNQLASSSKKITVLDEATTASDSDRIEKIWVDKAKAIIKDSAGDPHKKSANLSTEKTQYRNARFNKLISSN
jgi:hypothetical protein